ncbi:GDSL-type esterase/lipase family protein [Oceanihabitans sp. 2_MG-2023]|uniref:SGNH/GDSL hydrolase family protein n=1 Tax=Oceanihabitans sp. 2_MG-2023 TaxID=3062661 RepID=UPI0026E31D0E|nr:GDSL-type esterase/lipase family protein [Oceanihabitans sp. 2_MG-2023]MDO6597633.1 GDSL-type esterase/lipase family protein [Oceanihabitans sp. 2_MG-2023]
MKKTAILLPFLVLTTFFALQDCHKNEENSNTFTQNNVNTNTITIMPLGDSRVEGATSNSVSYRYDLWKDLVSNEWDIDYVGTQNDNTSYPLLLGKSFDPDHEGIGGFKSEDVLENIEEVMDDAGTPDVVLLGIGGNDLVRGIPVEEIIDNINQTIDILQNSNANITIFLERIAPGRSNVMTPDGITAYNSYLEQLATIALEQTNEASKIILVDMSTNWTDDYMADNLHYNELGAKEIADRYFEAIVENLEK